MRAPGHRRQILLFLIAVIVPSLVLLVLSIRMITEERELAEKRLVDEQRRRAADVRQELLTRLEGIKLREEQALSPKSDSAQAAEYSDPSVVLVGRVVEGRLILPWEANSATDQSQQLLNEPAFAQKIQQGENEELAAKQFEPAVASYRQALRAAHHPIQAHYAELLLARALAKLGRRDEAIQHYRHILAAPANVIDEQGVPFSLYAAERLADSVSDKPIILSLINVELDRHRWLPPTEVYMIRGLADRLTAESSGADLSSSVRQAQEKIAAEIRLLEEALALQNDFANLRLRSSAGQTQRVDPLWVPYGTDAWLISAITNVAGDPQAAIAVRFDDVSASLDSLRTQVSDSAARLIVGSESKGESLGDNLPGLRVLFIANANDASRRWSLQRAFYLVALILVLSITSFGAYLFWLDMKREMRMVELRSQFVSSVSHELKTPLTAIRMFAETLRMGRATNQRTQNEYLDTIVNESERLTRLLNNVLDFSKIEQGKKTYHQTSTSLAEVVQTAVRALEYPLSQEGFELHVAIEDNLPPVRVDRDAVQQAILNLLSNAMKYSPGSREIDLRLQGRNGEVVIQVTDQGIGIAPEERIRIFEKFYRAGTPENKMIPGTGLGLTLVEHMANAHGGRVEVESRVGEGSTFSIYLPIESPTNSKFMESV